MASLFLLCTNQLLYSQRPSELSPGYYVVVGAYAPNRENVAKNYTELLMRRGFDNAAYGFNSEKNLYFVYLRHFPSLRESLTNMEQTRKDPVFSDAWVRVVSGVITSTANAPAKEAESVSRSINAEDKKIKTPIERASATDGIAQPVTAQQTTSPPQAKSITTSTDKLAAGTIDIEVTDNPPIKQYPRITLGNTEVFLSLFNSTNNRIIDGIVTVIDSETNKPLKQVKGNEYLTLPNPKSKSGKLILQCEAFGYRKVLHEISYNLPLADTVKDYIDLMGTTFVVNFNLVRYHKGDMATLFNVYFYNDAAIMLPDSKTELGNLLALLQENEHYRIMLHGHTNGNYHGKILMMGEDKNFFSIDGSKSTVGSAKDLSYDRAEVIKEYLVANGIKEDRIELKAWGGKRPIYDKHSVNAKKNVRVEVEILAD